jgi:hypothetical protein
MRRRGAKLMLVLLLALGLLAGPAQAQVGYDRPGGDYASSSVRSADPAQCAARCERDSRCRAWAFSYPATESSNAMCWLKSRVPARVAVPCCVSGVRGAGVIEPRGSQIEFGIDRSGGDYRSFELPPDPTGRSCQSACQSEARCRAWTYARQGYSAPSALCFLKDRLTRPQHKPCCISGVVK